MKAMRIHQLGGAGGSAARGPARADARTGRGRGPGPGGVAELSATCWCSRGSTTRSSPCRSSRSPTVRARWPRSGRASSRVKPGDRVAAAFMPGWIGGEPDRGRVAVRARGGGIGHARRDRRAPRRGRRVDSRPPHVRGGGHAALRGGHRLARPGDGGAASRPGDTVLSRGRAASRSSRSSSPGCRGAGDRHVEQRREARDERSSSARRTASTTRPRPTGTRPSAS